MSGMVASFGPVGTWWEHAVAELAVYPDERVVSRTDGDFRASLAVPTGEGKGGIAVAEHCMLALDGCLDDGDDARALLERYLHVGDEFACGVRGEFAFVLWDSRRRKLMAGCDVLARRPLAFVSSDEMVAFATRAVSLLRHPATQRRWNQVYLADWLCGLAAQSQEVTAFEGIARVRAGHAVVWKPRSLSLVGIDSLVPADRIADANGYHEAFWTRLGNSVRRQAGRAAIALSGGIDSACVASAWPGLDDGGADAFSYVADDWGDGDERNAIAAFLRAHPAVRWHAVDCTGVQDASLVGPIQDDPDIIAPALITVRRRLLAAVAASGGRHVLDGEGGDEIFDIAVAWGDLLESRQFGKAALLLATSRHWRALALRQGVVPRLPRVPRALWFARERRLGRLIPPWTSKAFLRSAACRTALAEFEAHVTLRTFSDRVRRILTGVGFVGAHAATRLVARSHGINVVSPIVAPSIVELAMAVPPDRHVSSNFGKAFIREAALGILPEAVRCRRKDNGAYTVLVRRLLDRALGRWTDEGSPISEGLRGCLELDSLATVRARVNLLSLADADALYTLIRGVEWMARIEREFHVS